MDKSIASVFVCGDIVNHTPGINFIGEELRSIINNSDYSVCNFEGPEALPGQKVRCLHQEPGTAKYLKESGFDMMLLANNHITELGADGVEYSIKTIKDAGADCIGAGLSWDEAYRTEVREIRGLRFGFINICEAQVGQFLSKEQKFGYAWMGYEDLFKDISQLSQITDSLIVFVHSGLEHYSIPLPEIRVFYRRICDAGASLVIGGHTHSAQGYEHYGQKLIIYSLGNFFFPYTDNINQEENTSYSVVVLFDSEGISGLKLIQHRVVNGVVELVKNDDSLDYVDQLCNLLNEGYEQSANKMCIDAYKKLCSILLAEATCGEFEGISIKQYLKKLLDYIVFRKRSVINTQKYRDSLMLRLFENESYYWTIKRALRYKILTEYGK